MIFGDKTFTPSHLFIMTLNNKKIVLCWERETYSSCYLCKKWGGVLNFALPDLHECNSGGRVNSLRFV